MKLEPTLPLETAIQRVWDCLVVGAGPAGASAARKLARAGLSVLCIDRARFPRAKVCGCCLNASTLEQLDEAGLSGLADALGAVELDELNIVVQGERFALPLQRNKALSRERLDAALIQAAIAAGVSFLPEVSAGATSLKGEFRSVELQRHGAGAGVVRSRVVIAATGLNDTFLDGVSEIEVSTAAGSYLGAAGIVDDDSPHFAPGKVFMCCSRHGYVGLVRLEDGRLNLAAALSPETLREHHGPEAAAAAILAESGLPAVRGGGVWHGTPLLTRRHSRVSAPRLLLTGDAARYVEPFTGEGIAWALRSGTLCAGLTGEAFKRGELSAVEARWEEEYRRRLAPRQGLCRIVTTLLRMPRLSAAALALCASFPGLFGPLLKR